MPAPHQPRLPARERLVEAGMRLFSSEGVGTVGVDRVCAEAGVSKRSLYQHFATKDDLVATSLDAIRLAYDGKLSDAPDGATPREQILGIFSRQRALTTSGEFCGCPFVSVASELHDSRHPAAAVARQAKDALTAFIAGNARDAGARDPDALAVQLSMVYDGAAARAVVQAAPLDDLAERTAAQLLDAAGVTT